MEEKLENVVERIKELIAALNQNKVTLAEVSNKDLNNLLKLFDEKAIDNISSDNIQKVKDELLRRKERNKQAQETSADIKKVTEPVVEKIKEDVQEAKEEIEEIKEKIDDKVDEVKEDVIAKEAQLKRLEFENSLLKISDLDYEPKKEDYDFTDAEWNEIYSAWLSKHPEHVNFPDQEATVEVSRAALESQEEEEEESIGLGWLKWLLLILLLALLLLGGFFGWRWFDSNRKAKSLEELKSQLVFEANKDIETPVIEAGEELTYSDTDIAGLKNVPDQIRNYFASLPEGADVKLSEIDTQKYGSQEVTVTLSKKDKYGQLAENYQGFMLNIEDTQEPEITLNASKINIDAGDAAAIRANVGSVIDPVFGEYKYSNSRENRTYYIDTSNVKFEEPGTYPVTLVVYDNGNEIKQEFEVTVAARAIKNNSSNTAYVPAGPVYTYVDQYGNLFTEEQAKDMAAHDGNVELHTYEEFVAIYDSENKNKGDYTSAQAACYATFGTWDGRNCNH